MAFVAARCFAMLGDECRGALCGFVKGYIRAFERSFLPRFLSRKREESMKILMAAMSMGLGGAETHVLELSRALAERGHEVFVASSGGVYASELQKYGVHHAEIPLASKKTAAKAAFLLARLIEKERFDIVHAHARIPAFICGRLQKRYGFAFITTAHFDFYAPPILRKMTDWGERVLAVSADIAEGVAKKYGYPREKIAIVNNGIDTARFSPLQDAREIRARFDLDGKKVIMYLGRLDEDSFLPADALLDAAAEIYRERNDARVLIVGDGKMYGELCRKARLINEKCGAEIAFLPGGTAKPERYFAACDVFVGPSRSAMEAMASGKPTILAGNFGMLGIFSPDVEKEALRTNFCCRGSEPTTSERISACVRALFSLDCGERAKLGEYGRAFIERHYSTSAMADVCEREYDSLLSERGKKIVLCGYYGAENIGDEAMLSTLVDKLKKRKSVRKITVLSADAAKTAARFGVCSVPRYNIARISRAFAEADAVIFGGGNILQDKTSARSLFYYTAIARLAVKHACRLIFSANGIGPIFRGGSLALAKKALAFADYISMREERSRRIARALTGRKDIFASGDLAFASGESAFAEEKRGKYFAVFPKEVKNFRFAELARFCAVMRRRHGLFPVFVPMHKGEDARLCIELAGKIPGALYKCARCERDVRGVIRGAEFTVCMRLHAAVFSAMEGSPILAISDDGKMASFLAQARVEVFDARVRAKKLIAAAEDAIEKRMEKQELLGKFAEQQKALVREELLRICKLLGV